MYESHIYFIRTGKTRRYNRRLLTFPQRTKSAELLPHGIHLSISYYHFLQKSQSFAGLIKELFTII